jgi:hypothetical protein
MTIAVRISNEDGERGHVVRVRKFAYVKGESGAREQGTQDIPPGQSAVFYIHTLLDLRVEEGPIVYVVPA